MIIKKFQPIETVTNGNHHYFFGYYDKSPWDSTQRFMLCLEVGFVKRPPKAGDPAKICLIDLRNNNQLTYIGETRAWNWQQGCMLQWMPTASDRQIIYNDRRQGRLVSVIHDIYDGEIKILPMPIYSIDAKGNYALSLNFSRLDVTRPGYGYARSNLNEFEKAPEDDGIFFIDLGTGRSKLINSISDLAKFSPRSDMLNTNHWINHIQIRPDGKRFSFLHRWAHASTGKRLTRLFTSNIDGSDIYLLSDRNMVSHYDWKDNEYILAWAKKKKRDNLWCHFPFWQKLGLRNNEAYLLFKDQTQSFKIVGRNLFNTDGHCSFSPDRKWILTDTYPDKNLMRTLILFNPKKHLRIDLGRFFSPSELTQETRCDLHPRWSRDGLKIAFDSVHEGNRRMYVMEVEDIIHGN